MSVSQLPDDAPQAEVNGGSPAAVVKGTRIVRRFGEGDAAVDALRGVSVDIAEGRLTAVMCVARAGRPRSSRTL
jgi:putative ABC transport system ATP-binding protein